MIELRPLDVSTAANPISLPEPKPRAMREQIVVTAIRSREITQAQRSSVRHCEDALQPLNFSNTLLSVHSVSII